MEDAVREILELNDVRYAKLTEYFNPVIGENSIGDRVELRIPDYELPVQLVPREMMDEPFIKHILKCGSIDAYLCKYFPDDYDSAMEHVHRMLIKIRSKHDFAFWAYTFVRIKPKSGGDDIPFKLNRPQRRLVAKMEEKRRKHKPIRIILLKARQWGGSTVIQMYFAWMQLVHKRNWNSVIASHANSVSATVRGMYSKMLDYYPHWMLYPLGEEYDANAPKITGFEGQQTIQMIPSRQCKIRIATANAQENLRSEDVSMAHATEVALWPDTTLLHPEDFVDAVMSSIDPLPDTIKVIESTAKGSGNYFHREFEDAMKGIGEYTPVCVTWKEIEKDTIPFQSEKEREDFARWLWENRTQKEAPNRRSESGEYLWQQWEDGATLEGLNWYVTERRGKSSHDHMASEAPSNWVEAFSATGEELFSREAVEDLRKGCKLPRHIGEVQGDSVLGPRSLHNVHFTEDERGDLAVWALPEKWEGERIANRYLVVVDIGGLSQNADWSVILVIDRYWMMDGGRPTVVAQWRGHIDHDILAWKAAQIAKFYDNALLVVESNTLDRERDVNADISEFILAKVKDEYDNLYMRQRKEEDAMGRPTQTYGWHTNRDTKPKIITHLRSIVRDKGYVERDEQCLEEFLVYVKDGRKYEAKSGYHDDLLMTRAIGLWISTEEMEPPRIISTEKKKAASQEAASYALM